MNMLLKLNVLFVSSTSGVEHPLRCYRLIYFNVDSLWVFSKLKFSTSVHFLGQVVHLKSSVLFVEILKSTETKRQLVPSYGMNITKINHTPRTPGTITRGYTKPVPLRRPNVRSYTEKNILSRRLDTQTLSTKIGWITTICKKQLETISAIPGNEQPHKKVLRNNMHRLKWRLARSLNFPHMS